MIRNAVVLASLAVSMFAQSRERRTAVRRPSPGGLGGDDCRKDRRGRLKDQAGRRNAACPVLVGSVSRGSRNRVEADLCERRDHRMRFSVSYGHRGSHLVGDVCTRAIRADRNGCGYYAGDACRYSGHRSVSGGGDNRYGRSVPICDVRLRTVTRVRCALARPH